METDLQTQVAQWAEMRELGRQSPDFLVQLKVGRRATQVSVVLISIQFYLKIPTNVGIIVS
jgi:hypothetical protein